MQITGTTLKTGHGDKSGLILSNGQQGSGQSVSLSGTSGSQNVQVEIRTDHATLPINFDITKQYTVTIEEVA